jgi:hypothetical protein
MIDFDAFISYSSKDKAIADAACAALEAGGIRCWIAPRDIIPGSDWSASIVEALDQCRVMVLIFSADANESPQIRNEIARAVQRGVPVLPVRIENITPTKSLAYYMTAVHWLDALTPPLEQHLQRLGDSIKALLQVVPAEGTADRVTATPLATRRPQPVTESATVPIQGGGAFRLQTWVVRGLAAFACVVIVAGAVLLYLRATNTEACQRMWVERNSYYKLRGYCFQTPRAVSHFGNEACNERDAAKIFRERLSPIERDRVNAIRNWEWIYACPA